MIHDGSSLAHALHGDRTPDPRSYLLAFHPDVDPPPLDVVAEDAPPLLAEVNRGAWIARCPCREPGPLAPGGVVWFDAPLVWCLNCRNAAVGGGWRPVWLPTPETRATVERLLGPRPPEARNWTPDEAPDDLARENAEHGLEVA